MNKRWLIWLPLLGIAAWLATSEPSEDELASPQSEVVVAAVSSGSVPTPTGTNTKHKQAGLERLIPREELFSKRQSKTRRDLFASVSWLPPPAPVYEPAVSQEPPPPAFNYVGKQFDGKDWEVFLSLADRTYIAKAGAVLADSYKVERIDGSAVTVVDLRTSQSQTLSIGDEP